MTVLRQLVVLLLTTSISTTTTTTRIVVALSTTNPSISYRNAKEQDLPAIADLLLQTFEEDESKQKKEKNDSWMDLFWKSTFHSTQQQPPDANYIQAQLKRRMDARTMPLNNNHMMIVGQIENSTTIVGFMELGTMPSPVSIQVKTPEDDDEEETFLSIQPERPFLANVAVNADFQRQRIGTRLVQLAIQIATKWELQEDSGNTYKDTAAMYLSVEQDNEAAIRLYEKLDFQQLVFDKRDKKDKKDKKDKTKTTRTKIYFEKKLYHNE